MGRKTTVWIFQAINWRNLAREDMDMVKRENESPLKASQNNALRINHINAKTDTKQQSRLCRLCGDKSSWSNDCIGKKLSHQRHPNLNVCVCVCE